jgi:hypothetical protein
MSRETRKALIERIEKLRGSRVVTYITGDRNPTAAQIGDDAVRPLYEQLRTFGKKTDKIDLFIYSRGGAIDVPWRIASALRQASDCWNILVPFRANSAATLIALGADQIVFGRHGELGPIDPILSVERMVRGPGGGGSVQENINVEDLMSYVRFVRERAGLSDQASLTHSLAKLTDRLDALLLGNAYRTHSHIRDVARRMISSRKEAPKEQTLETIVETLAERVYAHGHAICSADAEQIGLPVVIPDETLEAAMWELWTAYEGDLKVSEPIDPFVATAGKDLYEEEGVIAIIETTAMAFEHQGKIEIRAERQMPQNLNLSVTVNLQLPPQVAQAMQSGQRLADLGQVFQQMMQQAQQDLTQRANQAVQDALRSQAPVAGLQAGFRGGRWVRVV